MKTKYIYIIVLLINFTAHSQTLDNYLAIAAENSPELKSIQYRYESALEKINEVGSIPNTNISVGYFAQEVETRVGAQKAKISASQMLPWFGTLNAKKESAQFNAKAQLNTYDFAKRKLFLEIKAAYFELYELKSKEDILLQNIEILKTFETLALNELENNRSTMVEVLKIRIEKNELTNQLNAIQENLNAKKVAFNLLLNRNQNNAITIVDQIAIINSEDFNKDDISNNPKMLALDNLKNATNKTELATKKESLPSIGIGLDYGFIEKRNLENLIDNGKDIIMPMITISVPLFSKKYTSKQKQLQLEQKAIESSKENTFNKLNTIFETAKSNLVSSKVSIKTQIKNIAETKRAKEVLLAAYETSKIDFEQLLEIQQLELKFQLKKVLSEKEYAIQRSTLEFLTKEN